MDTLDSKHLVEIGNQLKKIDADDKPALQWSLSEIYKGCEEFKALLKEIKLYTKEKCELEKELMQAECKIKQTEKNLYKNIYENKKNHSELQILIQQEEKKKFELSKKYEDMLHGKSQRLRDSHKYYQNETSVKELAMDMEVFEEWSKKNKQAQNVADDMHRQSNEMSPSIPYDVFYSIMSKEANDEENNPQNNKTLKN